MKQMTLLLAASAGLWAQAVVSPEVGADGRVTFRMAAPKTSEVLFYGDWMPVGDMSWTGNPRTDGANAFALAPGIVLLYERNVRTAEQLDAHGYHIVYEDDLLLGRNELETWTDKKYAIQIQGNELSRARGGPRCMTMPLEREDV